MEPASSTQPRVMSEPDPAGLRLGHRGLERVGLAVVGHPRGLQGEQVRALPVGLHLEEPGGGRGLGLRGTVVVDDHAGLLEQLAGQVERRPGAADGHRGHQRTGVVERRHRAGEALLGVDLRGAEQVRGRDPAVGEGDRGGVGGPDAELVLEALDHHAGGALLDDERLDRGPAERLVQRRPDDHAVGALARGDVDLLAVDDVLVAVLDGGGADARGVRAGARLGDRHRRPGAGQPLLLLVVRDGGDRGVAQALPRHAQQQRGVAPAHLGDREHRGQVGAVLDPAVVVLAAPRRA